MNQYFFEYTATSIGQANYSWVNRYLVKAKTLRGALIKVSKEIGLQKALKIEYNTGDSIRWNIKNSNTCLFYQDNENIEDYFNIKNID